MGEVWQGTDLLLNRRVAVKLLRPEHVGDQDLLTRFGAEARYAGSLSHPNIAQVYDFCEPEPPGQVYLVMEFVEGSSLAWLLTEGPLDPAHTMDIIAQAAWGLAAAHQAGVIHRDIKPGNLLVRDDGLVKVSDFGIASGADSTPVTRTGFLPGTPVYMAPERAAGASATPASDLYSLGIVAYQCLTGQLPFEGGALAVAIAHIEREIPPLPPSVPPRVAALVSGLTSKDPEERPVSAADVAQRAERARDALSPNALSPAGDATPVLPMAAVAGHGPRGLADHAGSVPPSPGSADHVAPVRARIWRAGSRRALAPLALSGFAAIGLIGWMLAAAHSPPATHPPPAPAVTARPGHHVPGPRPAVPADSAAPAASPSPSRTASRSASPSPSPSAIPSPSPTPAPSSTVAPSPTPGPSVTPTAPVSTPSAGASVVTQALAGDRR